MGSLRFHRLYSNGIIFLTKDVSHVFTDIHFSTFKRYLKIFGRNTNSMRKENGGDLKIIKEL